MNDIRNTALVFVCFAAPVWADGGLIGMVRERALEVPLAGPGLPMLKTGFKEVPNPDYADPNELPPPHLKAKHVKALIGRMAELELSQRGPGARLSDLSLSEKEAKRLVAALALIDRNYVDAIPSEVWDKAVADMGEVAAERFDVRKNNWEPVINAMINEAASKILDPFSVYWNKDEFKRFQDLMTRSFVGIGVILKEDGTIDLVIPDGPAEKAGLRAGDTITTVDAAPVRSAEQITKKSLGKAGTAVRIAVSRGGAALPAVTVIRRQLQEKNVFAKLAAPGVGYVYLGLFSRDSDKELLSAVGGLREKGARSLIIDVRGNPGGEVEAVSAIVSEFMKDKQRIVSFKRQGQVLWENVTDGDGRFLDMPLAVLVNGGSASASEILAGAIQDARGPVIVGSRSYGKGSMQTIAPDGQGGALKLTVGRWYTPRDRNIDSRRDPQTHEKIEDSGGIIPDHLIVLPEETERAVMRRLFRELQGAPPDGAALEDPVLQKALELLAPQTVSIARR